MPWQRRDRSWVRVFATYAQAGFTLDDLRWVIEYVLLIRIDGPDQVQPLLERVTTPVMAWGIHLLLRLGTLVLDPRDSWSGSGERDGCRSLEPESERERDLHVEVDGLAWATGWRERCSLASRSRAFALASWARALSLCFKSRS